MYQSEIISYFMYLNEISLRDRTNHVSYYIGYSNLFSKITKKRRVELNGTENFDAHLISNQ